MALFSGLLLISQSVSAGRILDYIRDFDLNDYALGMGVSAEQNPFAGAENSTFAYPYLTSFHHSSMTDDWVLACDGELGVRWITENNWELGVIGRIQTLGFSEFEGDALRGVADCEWALEMDPTIGWRGWRIHVNWTTYLEPVGSL